MESLFVFLPRASFKTYICKCICLQICGFWGLWWSKARNICLFLVKQLNSVVVTQKQTEAWVVSRQQSKAEKEKSVTQCCQGQDILKSTWNRGQSASRFLYKQLGRRGLFNIINVSADRGQFDNREHGAKVVFLLVLAPGSTLCWVNQQNVCNTNQASSNHS